MNDTQDDLPQDQATQSPDANAADAPKPARKRAPRKPKAEAAPAQETNESANEGVNEAANEGISSASIDDVMDAPQVMIANEAEAAQTEGAGEAQPRNEGRLRRGPLGPRRQRGERNERREQSAERAPRRDYAPRDAGAAQAETAEGSAEGGNENVERAEHGERGERSEREFKRPAPRVVNTEALLGAVVSGEFDAHVEPAADEAEQTQKRVLEPTEEAPKLHKLLAQIGIASRREIEELIMAGRISVNGEPAHVGQRILYSDQVRLNGKPLKLPVNPPKTRVLVYHKPAGEVCTTNDPEGRPTVFTRLPHIKHGRWVSVGRLDLNTEGLLLFTTSGELANRLMHPKYEIEREYAVRVLGEISDEQRQQLKDGVTLDDGVAQFTTFEHVGGEGANRWYRAVLNEGRNREVRRMIEAVGCTVSRLIRVRYSHLALPSILKRGQWTELEYRDVNALQQRVGLTGGAGRGAQGAGRDQQGAGRGGFNNRPPQNRGPEQRRRGSPDRGAHQGRRPNNAGFAPRQNDNFDEHEERQPREVMPKSHGDGFVQAIRRDSRNGGGGGQRRFGGQGGQGGGGGMGQRRGGGGFGGGQGGGQAGQPDPLKTSFGYVQHGSGGKQGAGGGGAGGRQRRGGGNQSFGFGPGGGGNSGGPGFGGGNRPPGGRGGNRGGGGGNRGGGNRGGGGHRGGR